MLVSVGSELRVLETSSGNRRMVPEESAWLADDGSVISGHTNLIDYILTVSSLATAASNGERFGILVEGSFAESARQTLVGRNSVGSGEYEESPELEITVHAFDGSDEVQTFAAQDVSEVSQVHLIAPRLTSEDISVHFFESSFTFFDRRLASGEILTESFYHAAGVGNNLIGNPFGVSGLTPRFPVVHLFLYEFWADQDGSTSYYSLDSEEETGFAPGHYEIAGPPGAFLREVRIDSHSYEKVSRRIADSVSGISLWAEYEMSQGGDINVNAFVPAVVETERLENKRFFLEGREIWNEPSPYIREAFRANPISLSDNIRVEPLGGDRITLPDDIVQRGLGGELGGRTFELPETEAFMSVLNEKLPAPDTAGYREYDGGVDSLLSLWTPGSGNGSYVEHPLYSSAAAYRLGRPALARDVLSLTDDRWVLFSPFSPSGDGATRKRLWLNGRSIDVNEVFESSVSGGWTDFDIGFLRDGGTFWGTALDDSGERRAVRLLKVDLEIHDENGNPQLATEDNPANVPVNGDFDEEKQVNGRYVRDYEDANLEFATDSNDLKTDDLRGCVVDIPGLTDDVWQNTTLKICKKAGVIDPETNEEEAGEIRMHAIDGSNNWVEVQLDTDLAPDFYVSTGQYANYDSCWIEGIKDGPITIEVEIVINGGTPILVEKKAMICTEKTKAEWQQEVWDDIQLVLGVDASTFDPNNSFIDNNDQLEAIYDYYGETFLRDDENYLWPGLGKLAGASVYGGLVDAELGKTYTSIASFFNEFFSEEVDELIDLTTLALDEIQGILMGGANDIFKDLAWQFKAYHTSGLCAINYVFDEEGSLLVDVDVWENIDEGVNGANTFLSGIGNRDIADREQNIVIQPTFSLLDQRGWEPLFSFLATNPVPGAPMFKDSVQGGEITDAADRWSWVLNDMWYLYTGTPVHTQRDWASETIYELSKPHARTY